MNRTIILVACIASTLWCNAQAEVATSQTDSTKKEAVSPVIVGDSTVIEKKTDEAKGRKAHSDKSRAHDSNKVYDRVETMPQFPGGSEALLVYLKKNLRYPAAARRSRAEGKVFVQYVVDTDGSITNVKVIRGISPALDAEAVRVVQAMPKWTPGYTKGVPCKVKFVLPITFKYGRT